MTWRLAEGRKELSPAARDVVMECLLNFHRERYRLYAYVVMNDHVHAIAQPLPGFELSQILHTWKSYTAHAINKAENQSGSVWQDESHNRIVRSEAELHQKVYYVITNPQRRWPDIEEYKWAAWLPA